MARPNVDVALERITRRLDRVLDNQQQIYSLIRRMGIVEMVSLADVKAKQAELMAKVTEDDDIVSAIATAVDGQKTLILDLKQQLQDAINAGAPQAEVQEILDTMQATLDKVSGQQVAEKAIINTDAAPAP